MTNTEKQLTLDQLIPGDVLVMQGPQDVSWPTIIADGDMDAALIQAIMWLTNSDVCHGAIYYGESNQLHSLIDDGEKGVGQHGMTQSPGKPDTWYVRRLNNEQSLTPVLALAKKYTGEKTAYDWELLTLLGLLLIYKKITPESSFYQSLLVILEKLVVTLDQLTHNKSTEYFVCSQFVAACFDQSGAPYELHVKDGNLLTQADSVGVSVLDHCSSFLSLAGDYQVTAVSDLPLGVQDLKLLVESQASQENAAGASQDEQNRMAQACDQFLLLFFQMNDSVLGLNSGDYASTSQRLQLAQRYQADFVTPADLKSHCTNLDPIGMIEFVYGKAMP